MGSHLGLPDAGLASYRDMVERVRTLSALTTCPLICDGDTGFGGLLNATWIGLEAAKRAGCRGDVIEIIRNLGIGV